jgi:hypothetical protein
LSGKQPPCKAEPVSIYVPDIKILETRGMWWVWKVAILAGRNNALRIKWENLKDGMCLEDPGLY